MCPNDPPPDLLRAHPDAPLVEIRGSFSLSPNSPITIGIPGALATVRDAARVAVSSGAVSVVLTRSAPEGYDAEISEQLREAYADRAVAVSRE